MDFIKTLINGKNWLFNSSISDNVKRADEKMYRETGKHILITYAYRSPEAQSLLYKTMKAKDPRARVSPPGKSFHEKGLAVDVSNWQEAAPYLNAEGLVNPMADDKGHFSYGEFGKSPLKTTGVSLAAIALIAVGAYLIYNHLKVKGEPNLWNRKESPQITVET